MPRMTQPDIEEYLGGKHIVHLATLNADGSAHVVPIWYMYDGGKIYMIGGSGVKARNIRRDPRVTVSITGPEQPYKYVLIEGKAQLITEEIEQLTLAVAARYMGEDKGAEFAREILDGRTPGILIITPINIITQAYERIY